MSRTRRLAAIMFTDIKGYTALMQQDEARAVQARNKHRRIFNAATEKYGGTVLQYYGDGTLSIFDSALDAVQCGIEMQLGFREPPELPVRIGIHTGDIVFSEEEIIGDSVNIASRIESLAAPGSVFLSDKVYDEIKNQADIRAVRLKAFRLKNIEKPIEVYAIANEGLVVPPAEEVKGKTEPEAPPSKPRESGMPILATKLFLPSSRHNTIARPRLSELLNKGLNGKFTLISAPAGFGKTTLAAEWAANCGRPVAWLSLDEQDSLPTRFLAYLTAALQKVEAGFGESVQAMLQSPQPPSTQAILTALINEIAALPAPFVLVLDDYHVVDSPAVDEALAFLLGHLPPQLHLAITTREDPQFPLARLRARGQLTELRAADLRFTAEEAAGFLNQAMGLNLSAEDVAALESRTEGWIAGLQMAALSMQGREDTAGFIRAFTGSHRFVLDYLAEEVLNRQPAATRNFLLQTAILERLCGPLCDAVTGQEGGGRMLEELEHDNLFVVPLDDERRWYRYHHLFADVLRARLKEERGGQLPALHRRASEWYEQHGLPAESIHHALAADDLERAAALIERTWPAMDANFQSAAWIKWANALPEAMIRNRPVLLMGIAWAHLNDGELEAGEARLEEAEKWLNQPAGEMVVADEEQFQSLPASLTIARIYLAQARGDVAAAIAYARGALHTIPEDNPIARGQWSALLGTAYWSEGNLDAAYEALDDTMNLFLAGGVTQFAISVTYGLADIRITQGRLGEAINAYEKSLRLVEKQNEGVLRGTAELYLGLGSLHRERGEMEAAARQLQKGDELGPQAALPNWPSRRCIVRAQYEEARGNPDGALALLDEAERLYFRTPMPNIRPIPALKAALWARRGRLAEAGDWARRSGLSAADELSFLREYEYLTLARVIIAQYRDNPAAHSIQDAIGLLERLLRAAEAGGRRGSAIEILIQQALAYEALGNTERALAPLERALALAEPEGYVRTFADEGAPMKRLLEESAAEGGRPGYARQLLAAFGSAQAAGSAEPKGVRAEPRTPAPQLSEAETLSPRELEILQLIARGLSNQQISERLFLALSTVKGHNRNIFDKMGVKRRTEAVARARELGVIG